MPVTHPYSLNGLETWEITCGWKIRASWAIIPNVTSNKNELWKPFRRTSLQKAQLQSVLVFFKFFHSCLFLYLLCYLFIILISWAIFFLIGGSSHRLHFGKFRRLRVVSLFSWSVEQNARDTQMTTREIGALVSRVSRLCRSTLARECTSLTKSEEKDRLLAVYKFRDTAPLT